MDAELRAMASRKAPVTFRVPPLGCAHRRRDAPSSGGKHARSNASSSKVNVERLGWKHSKRISRSFPKAPLHGSRAPARYYGAMWTTVKPNTHGWIFCELVPGLQQQDDRHLPSCFSSFFFSSFFFSTAAADDLSSGCL